MQRLAAAAGQGPPAAGVCVCALRWTQSQWVHHNAAASVTQQLLHRQADTIEVVLIPSCALATADDAGDASLEEWLQLEADEAWGDADTDEDDGEQQAAPAPGTAAAASSPANAQEGVDGSGSSDTDDDRSPSWSEGLPYKLKRGERGWDGLVPPDVVVITPPQRDADGTLQLPLPLPNGRIAATNGDTPAAQQRPTAPSRPQRSAPPMSRAATAGQGQKRREKAPQKGRRKGGDDGGGGGRSTGPDWLRNLPPAK